MVELKDLDTQIDTLVKNLTISDKFKNWAMKYLYEIRQNEAQSNETVLENKHKMLFQTTRQLDNLLLKYTSPENEGGQLISDLEYQTLKNRLIKEKTTLENELKTHGKVIEDWVELSERTFDFARYAQAWFNNGDMDTKRAIFAALGSHLIIKDQKLNVELHPYFKVIFENIAEAEKELVMVRTSENVLDKRQIAKVLSNCPTLRRGWDSNPRLPFGNTGFQDQLHQPLGHLSSSELYSNLRCRPSSETSVFVNSSSSKGQPTVSPMALAKARCYPFPASLAASLSFLDPY